MKICVYILFLAKFAFGSDCGHYFARFNRSLSLRHIADHQISGPKGKPVVFVFIKRVDAEGDPLDPPQYVLAETPYVLGVGHQRVYNQLVEVGQWGKVIYAGEALKDAEGRYTLVTPTSGWAQKTGLNQKFSFAELKEGMGQMAKLYGLPNLAENLTEKPFDPKNQHLDPRLNMVPNVNILHDVMSTFVTATSFYAGTVPVDQKTEKNRQEKLRELVLGFRLFVDLAEQDGYDGRHVRPLIQKMIAGQDLTAKEARTLHEECNQLMPKSRENDSLGLITYWPPIKRQ